MNSSTELQRRQFSFRLDGHSGVPVYRQLIDQVQGAIAGGLLRPGDQLPTVRLVAVELAINPNTVLRAYREMEIRGILDTQQGTGTFIADRQAGPSKEERERQLSAAGGRIRLPRRRGGTDGERNDRRIAAA